MIAMKSNFFFLNSLMVIYLCGPFIDSSRCFTASYHDKRLPESSVLEYLDATLYHQVTKRQTTFSDFTPEEKARCESQIGDVICSNGIAQGIIDSNLRCGNEFAIDVARRYANGCAKSERGEFCAIAFRLFDMDGIGQMNIEGNCSGVLASNNCPSTCRNLLRDFKSRLGCCINTYINGTLYRSSSSVDYRLWQLCGVSLPPADCGNGLVFDPPANVSNCTEEERFNLRYKDNVCLPSRGQPYINALLDSRCRGTWFSFAEYLVNLCSVNADGFTCGRLTGVSGDGTDIRTSSLDSTCASSDISCSSSCRNALVNAKNNSGCCVNYFNTTRFHTPLSLSYNVWQSCGVETPGFCESPLTLQVVGGASSVVKAGVTWMMIAALAIIVISML